MIRSTRVLHKLCTSAARSPLFSPVAAVNHRFSTGTASLVKESTETLKNPGNFGVISELRGRRCIISFRPHGQVTCANGENNVNPFLVRSFASKSSRSTSENAENRKDISTVEDPFDAPTYNIPEKPMTFTEGASYSLVILAGLGIAGLAGYGVFKELIFEPKEYKVFGKALHRIQNDNQISVRIGSPITGYGQQSRNRAARQRIPNRGWKDEDDVEHVEVNFYIRGPHGDGKVYSEMFKDKEDKQWKFMYLMVEITSPAPARILLESHLPA